MNTRLQIMLKINDVPKKEKRTIIILFNIEKDPLHNLLFVEKSRNLGRIQKLIEL